jgi:hypothetical protein
MTAPAHVRLCQALQLQKLLAVPIESSKLPNLPESHLGFHELRLAVVRVLNIGRRWADRLVWVLGFLQGLCLRKASVALWSACIDWRGFKDCAEVGGNRLGLLHCASAQPG